MSPRGRPDAYGDRGCGNCTLSTAAIVAPTLIAHEILPSAPVGELEANLPR